MSDFLRRARRLAGVALAAAALAGCAQNSPENAALGIYDPFEPINRDVHDFNKGADRLVLRPVASAYDAVAPDAARYVIRNALNHLELPRDFVNHLLIGEFGSAGRTVVRFAINTTLGFGGLIDIASRAEIEKEDADFGKTLAVWGVDKGFYYEIPLLGPSTVRHTVGRIVDTALAPTSYVLVPFAGAAVTVTSAVETRASNAEIIDDVLYGSGDSYVLTRSVYLQRRDNFVNGGEIDFDKVIPLE